MLFARRQASCLPFVTTVVAVSVSVSIIPLTLVFSSGARSRISAASSKIFGEQSSAFFSSKPFFFVGSRGKKTRSSILQQQLGAPYPPQHPYYYQQTRPIEVENTQQHQAFEQTEQPQRQYLTMAWRSHGTSNEDLVTNLKRNGLIHSKDVEDAMRQVDRVNYVKETRVAYQDAPSGIGYNGTISAPHMHAFCLEQLREQLQPGMRALDVGSGSGYLAVCMARMVGEKGRVVGIEHIPELTKWSIENVRRDPRNHGLLESNSLKLITGDGRLGSPADGPYNAIHVGAAAETVPDALIEQLAPGGRLIIPVGMRYSSQDLVQIDKLPDGTIKTKNVLGVIYVPLTSRDDQLSN